MDKRKGAAASELIGGIFGWIWILSSLSIPVLIIWTIWGEGRWYFILIAFVLSGFFKSLCRAYKQQSEKLYYESTGMDYAKEWLDLPEEDKKQTVIESLKGTINKLDEGENVEDWISKLDEQGRVGDIVKEISEGYRETGLKKPYKVVCNTFIENYFQFLAKNMSSSST